MKVFRKKSLSIITCLSIIFLVIISSQCYGQEWNKLSLTSGTYSEKDDLNRAVEKEFGKGFSIADWQDLKAIGNIDAWISSMGLHNGQTFMVTVSGKFMYSGNRQYFVHYSTTGMPPSGFLVHDKISNKLFLGSWFGENRKILVINKGGKNDVDLNTNLGHSEKNDQNHTDLKEFGNERNDANFNLTSRTYSEKDDLNRAVEKEFGHDFSIADWNDLKAIPNIDAWIAYMHLRNEQSFYVTRDGKSFYGGNRHYNVQYFASGKIPANYAIHDQIGNKLVLGSWYDLNEQILGIGTHSEKNDQNHADLKEFGNERNDANFNLTSRTYSEKDDLNRAVEKEFGHGFSIADWADLKAIGNIDAWISRMDLHNGQTFMITVNGKFIFGGNRQYFVYYSTTGMPSAGFLVHDKISNKLFLGSWFGENRKILVINKGGKNDVDLNPNLGTHSEKNDQNHADLKEFGNERNDANFNLTSRSYSEKDDLNRAVEKEFGHDFSIADWNDLKAIPNIDAWIAYMHLRNEQSFYVTRDGKLIFSGKRQYNVQYFASGKIPANYAIHDQIGNKLVLGSWYDLNEPILAIKKGNQVFDPIVKKSQNLDFIKLTDNKFSETQNLEEIVRKEFAGKCQVADWTDLKAMSDINAWISSLQLKDGQTFFVTRDGQFTYSGNRQYFVYYSRTGAPPAGFLVHDQIGNKLFLGSWFGEKRQILVRDYHNK
jgi:hypothetical protein